MTAFFPQPGSDEAPEKRYSRIFKANSLFVDIIN